MRFPLRWEVEDGGGAQINFKVWRVASLSTDYPTEHNKGRWRKMECTNYETRYGPGHLVMKILRHKFRR